MSNWRTRFLDERALPANQWLKDKPHLGRPRKAEGQLDGWINEVIEKAPRDFGYHCTTWTASLLVQYVNEFHQIVVGEEMSEKIGNQLLYRIIGDKSQSKVSPMERLSNRKLEIFGLIGHGLKTEDIARQLHLSTNTIGTDRERLKTKLKATSSAELTRLELNWVAENG